MDLRRLSLRNHINDGCTEYTGSEIFGRYCSTKKLKQEVFSVDHCAVVMNLLFHCAKKASIATTQKQSVIVTSQLLVVGSCIDDVTIGQHEHFESFGAVTG